MTIHKKRLTMTIAGMALTGLVTLSATAIAAPSQTQIDALKSVFDSLNGQEWTDQTGWNTVDDPCAGWFGVTCDASGTNVIKLFINGNNAFGSIPASISGLTELEELVITGTGLNGSTIPESIGTLSRLKGLFLNDNGLAGSIPVELGQLSPLETLRLDDNRLSGSIPIEVMSLTKLYGLSLHGNHLTGSIPEEISNLTQLRTITLHRNSLEGVIPSVIASMSELTEINMDWNALHSDDGTLNTFINQKSASENYLDTQTLDAAPNPEPEIGETAIKLFWEPRNTIPATTGGYKVYMATSAAGPFTLNQSIDDKASDGARVEGLSPNTTYFFQIRSFTASHEENLQPGQLESSGLLFAPKQVTTLAAGGGNDTVGEDSNTDGNSDGSTSSGGGGGSLAWMLIALLPFGFKTRR